MQALRYGIWLQKSIHLWCKRRWQKHAGRWIHLASDWKGPAGTIGLWDSPGRIRRRNWILRNCIIHQFTLRRVYKPVFTRKRGESEKHRTGNTTDYYINDVPYKAGDYSKFIEEHIGTEEDILTVSRVDYFAQVMKPDARRQKLLDLFANGVDDQSVIVHHSELASLGELLSTYTMDDCVKRWKAQRRKVNEDKDAIPGRIDEAERAKPDIESIETDSARLPKLAAERLKISCRHSERNQ